MNTRGGIYSSSSSSFHHVERSIGSRENKYSLPTAWTCSTFICVHIYFKYLRVYMCPRVSSTWRRTVVRCVP